MGNHSPPKEYRSEINGTLESVMSFVNDGMHRGSRRIAVDLPVRSNPPGVTCGVDETTLAFVIRLIFYGSDLPGPKLEGSLENGVNVLDVDVN